jgi:transmembrane sensor
MNLSPQSFDPAAEERASLWAARLDGSVLSAADRIALDEWLASHPAHRPLLSRYCQFSADLEQQLPLIEGIKELSAGTRTTPPTAQPHPWLRRPLMAGVALTAAAAVAVAFWLARPQTELINIATPVAHRQSRTLADGTQVELNAQTTIQVDFSGKERRVRLASGEAFFAVHKDPTRPFTVETPAGSVRVTGTQFNVRTETVSAFEVTVLEGSVQARPGETGSQSVAPVALTAGERWSAGPDGIKRSLLSDNALDDALAWRQGRIVFDGVPLREALARFARYHGRGITVTAAAADLPLGGRYSLDDLDGFFALLEEVLPVKVTHTLSGTIQVDLHANR